MTPDEIQATVAAEVAKFKAEYGAVKAWPWHQWLVYGGIILIGIASCFFLYNRFWPSKPIVAIPSVMPEASKAENVPKIVIAGPKKLQVYKKDELGKKIPLPPEVANNPQMQPTATAQLTPMPFGGTATSFTNISTGQSVISTTPKERPLFGFGGKTSVGLLGGISTKGSVGIGYVGQQILRVGPVELGVAAGLGIIGTDSLMGAVIHLKSEF